MAEKARYPFAAYPRSRCSTLLFCGCNLPSQFPVTTNELARVAREHGAGVAFDCCGRPLEEWGCPRAARSQGARLRRRLAQLACTRLVVACPNCLVHLRKLLSNTTIECVSAFEALREWGVEPQGSFDEGGVLFPPCPDRAERVLERQLGELAPSARGLETLHGVPCCGLAGAVAAQGVQAVQACTKKVMDQAAGRPLYTTCASCAGQFARSGYEAPVRHGLSVVLGIDERPDTARAFWNRARRLFDRSLEPLRPEEGEACSR